MYYLLLAVMILSIGCSDGKPAHTTGSHTFSTRLGYGSVTLPKTSRPNAENKKTYTRDEFKNLVVGKTMDEVKELLGKPYGASATNGKGTWYYTDVVFDPDTGEVDTVTYLHFVDGKVERIGD